MCVGGGGGGRGRWGKGEKVGADGGVGIECSTVRAFRLGVSVRRGRGVQHKVRQSVSIVSVWKPEPRPSPSCEQAVRRWLWLSEERSRYTLGRSCQLLGPERTGNFPPHSNGAACRPAHAAYIIRGR